MTRRASRPPIRPAIRVGVRAAAGPTPRGPGAPLMRPATRPRLRALTLLAVALALLLTGLAQAGDQASDPPDDPPECLIERQPRALAACLNLAAGRIEAATRARLGALAARAQAATAAEIARFERGLADAYRRYRTDTAAGCRSGPPLDIARCRYRAAVAQAARAGAEIAAAEAALGLSGSAPGAVRLEVRPLPGGAFTLDVILDGVAPLDAARP